MIRVTIWYERTQEMGEERAMLIEGVDEASRRRRENLIENARQIKRIHPQGMHMTLKAILDPCEDMDVTAVTMDMDEYGLPDALLESTDVLVWWGHMAHDLVPDELAERIQRRVLCGMGFVALHSAHESKPFRRLMGTSCTLRWRDDEFCRVWNLCPTHPIAEGLPEYFELPEEEMYGEFFDVPKPDDNVFVSWFRGGEVFRSGMTWTRGYGRVFFFQPGHETNPSYHNEYVKRVIINGVRWVKPSLWRDRMDCPHTPSLEK